MALLACWCRKHRFVFLVFQHKFRFVICHGNDGAGLAFGVANAETRAIFSRLEPNAATALFQLDHSAEWGVCECSVKLPFLVEHNDAVSLVCLSQADANLPIAIHDFKLPGAHSLSIRIWRGTAQNDDCGNNHCSDENAHESAAAFFEMRNALFKCHHGSPFGSVQGDAVSRQMPCPSNGGRHRARTVDFPLPKTSQAVLR